MAELGPFEDQEAELGEFEYLVSDITHIIGCLYKFSIAIRNPVPKDRLHKIALINVSHFEYWDIKHIEEKFRLVDPESNFRVAEYLVERLGKANTRRRQLLKYHEAHHKTIAQYIDSSSLPGAMELTNASKPVASTMGDGNARAPAVTPDLQRAATVSTTAKSQTTLSTIRGEISQGVGIEPDEEPDEEQLSLTSFATSVNYKMRIRVPSPPSEDAAFGGEAFQCPYCFNIIKTKNRKDWKYVNNLLTIFMYAKLNI